MPSVKRTIFLIGVILFFALPDIAQSNNANGQDDEFNIFLFTIATIFVCGMIGAAIIGAMGAALVIFFLFSLIALGVLSMSVAIGLYKKSFSKGFKSFLILLFTLVSLAIGSIGLLVVNAIFNLNLSGATCLITGALSGLTAGIIMGLATYKAIQAAFKFFINKFTSFNLQNFNS